ncbi:hypothetical protein SESBI_45699 [Sesbania bispinosa]|nr:hypothetical protein SESBI_45699 [Sesbania bispinosa]
MKHVYPFQSHSLLHSVRKSPAKAWKKAPVAPMPPTPVKVYKVDAINFRELVQQLTCAPEFKPHQPRHEIPQSIKQERTTIATSLDVPLPPKEKQSNREPAAGSPQLPVFTNNWFQDFQSEAFGMKSQENSDGAMTPGLLDMNLSSPTSFSNWSFFPPLSPRIM